MSSLKEQKMLLKTKSSHSALHGKPRIFNLWDEWWGGGISNILGDSQHICDECRVFCFLFFGGGLVLRDQSNGWLHSTLSTFAIVIVFLFIYFLLSTHYASRIPCTAPQGPVVLQIVTFFPFFNSFFFNGLIRGLSVCNQTQVQVEQRQTWHVL